MDVVRITDLAIRRIIKMAKRLTAFKELVQEDQIALIKGQTRSNTIIYRLVLGSCSELLILRGVMVFDPTKDVWNHHVYTVRITVARLECAFIQGTTDMEIKLDVLKRSNEGKHYEEHKR